ncbi:MAG: WD40/YVTN/BNR-like repeat-containing protein [Actinoallomurus sp.]
MSDREDFERELRRVLHDDRWSLTPTSNTLARVHAGAARRRRRRRVAAGGLSALSVIAVAVLAVTIPQQLGGQQSGVASSARASANGRMATPELTAKRPKSGVQSSGTERTTQPGVGGSVPADFAAASMTATGTSTFWVLGTAPCNRPPCTSIVRTEDGGTTFRGMPAPKAPLSTNPAGSNTVSDLRFADTTDGYAFGGSLWTTHDGARTWHQQQLPGTVLRVEAAHGTAWALLRSGSTHRLYRSATSSDSWSRVALPAALDDTTPDLVLQSGLLALLGGSSGTAVAFVSTDGGRSFHQRKNPCPLAFGAPSLSAAGGALWVFCATGTQGRPYVSTDDARTWAPVSGAPPGGWANSTVIGGRSASSAVLASGGGLYRVTTGGGVRRESAPSLGSGTSLRFVGFTTPQLGYAVLARPSTSSLLRSTDGGRTWSAVHYPQG